MRARIAVMIAAIAAAMIVGCAPRSSKIAPAASLTGSALPHLASLEARRRAACAALAQASIVSFSGAPTASLPEGERIMEIALRGARTVPAATVLAAMKTAPGEAVDAAKLDADLGRIHELGVFEDVRIGWEKREAGVAIVIEVDERPFVGAVFLAPNASVPEGGAWRPPLPGDLYEPEMITRALRSLERTWKGAGYLDARADVRARRVDDERVDLCFDLDQGPQWMVDRVTFPGAARVSVGELRAAMASRDGELNVEGKPLREDWLRQDRARLRALYYDRGHLRAEVRLPRLTRIAERHAVSVELSISEGAVYRVGKLTLRGALAGPRSGYAALVAGAPGQVYSHRRFHESLDKLRRHHRALTKKDAQIEPDLKVNDDKATVDLIIEVKGS